MSCLMWCFKESVIGIRPSLIDLHCFHTSFVLDKGLVINYGEGGATKWEIAGPKPFAPPLKTG